MHLFSLRNFFIGLLLVVLGCVSKSSAETLSTLDTGELKIKLSGVPGGYELSISKAGAAGAVINPSVFTLDGPPRLVVDIPNIPSKGSQKKELQDAYITSIRVGAHKDKTRFVLDLSAGDLPTYTVEDRGSNHSQVRFQFGASGIVHETATDTTDQEINKAIGEAESQTKDEVAKSLPKEELKLPVPKEKEAAPEETPTSKIQASDAFDILSTKKATPQEKPDEKKLEAKKEEQSEKPQPVKNSTAETKAEPKKNAMPLSDTGKSKSEIITVIGNSRIQEDNLDLDVPSEKTKPEAKKEEKPESLSNNQSTTEVAEPVDVKTTEPQEEAKKHSKKENEEKIEPPATTEEEAAEEEEPATEATSKKSQGSSKVETTKETTKVQGLFFKTVATTGEFAVAINGDNLDEFKLAKKKSNVWELVIQKAKLTGPYLSLPQFPPDSFHGFESVAAVQRDEDVIVRIFVEEDAKLSPFRSGKEIWVKVAE